MSQDYRSPTIVDRRDGEITVSVTPKPSQYALQVITFDTDKKVPLLVKNYKDTISNLVKMRRSRGFTPAAGTWLPSEIVMENFPMRATSTMTLQLAADRRRCRRSSTPPRLDKPSTLTWPWSSGVGQGSGARRNTCRIESSPLRPLQALDPSARPRSASTARS